MKQIMTICAVAALSTPAFADQPVTIDFAAEIGGEAFSCA